MGEIIPFIPLENLSDAGLIEYSRLIEDNAEAAVLALGSIYKVMEQRAWLDHPSPYDDFHDVFPDEPS